MAMSSVGTMTLPSVTVLPKHIGGYADKTILLVIEFISFEEMVSAVMANAFIGQVNKVRAERFSQHSYTDIFQLACPIHEFSSKPVHT